MASYFERISNRMRIVCVSYAYPMRLAKIPLPDLPLHLNKSKTNFSLHTTAAYAKLFEQASNLFDKQAHLQKYMQNKLVFRVRQTKSHMECRQPESSL